MILVEPSLIPKIDKYADEELLISPLTLMGRAGSAVANAVFSYAKPGSKVRIFAGKGNNGGDGYAAAALLISRYDVKVYDVFSAGQRTPEGMYFLNEYTSHGGVVEALDFSDEQLHDIDSADTLVDAVFGTGFFGELPQKAVRLCDALHSMEDKNIIAVDVPLGINSSDGRVIYSGAYHAKTTVTLGFVKTGLVSYPGKEYVGNIINDNIDMFGEANVFIGNENFDSLMQNIINNACRHGFINEENEHIIRLELSFDAINDYYILQISNNGVPMEESINTNSYSSYGVKAGKTSNTGLGGYIIETIVKRFNGSVEVEKTASLFPVKIIIKLPKYKEYDTKHFMD